MSDEPTPEIRALALRLFAAGRSERPGPALGRRLALIGQPTALPGPQRVEARVEAWRARLRSRSALVLAAASVLAGGAALWLGAEHSTPPISISPDPIRVPATVAGSEPGESFAREPVRAALPEADVQRAAQREEQRGSAPRPSKSAEGAARTAPASKAQRTAPQRAEPLTLLDELGLLKDARAALRAGDGQQALGLLDRYARERAGVSLDAEATLLRIEALSALGRSQEASELAARFVRQSPNSALGDRAKSFIRSAP